MKPYGRQMPNPWDSDPRDQPPNDTPPGVNPPPTTANPPHDFNPISVGPNASEGYGNAQVMYPDPARYGGPPPPSAWSGWPTTWDTSWGDSGSLLGRYGNLGDIAWACLDLNASILGSMPPYLVKHASIQDDVAWMTNPEPLVYSSWDDMAKELFWSYQGAGEAFVYATDRYSDGYPRRFIVLNPAHVSVDFLNGVREYRVNGQPIDSADILHIRYVSTAGVAHGQGPLEVGRARLLALYALGKYATNLATSGGLPPAVLKYPRRATRAQMLEMQADWVEARSNAMGVPAVLSDGTDLEVINSQLKDQALVELSKINEARVATLLKVPPFLLGIPTGDGATYVNSTNVFDYHWRAGLRPMAHAVMAALSGWLLPRGVTVELDRDEYTRPGMMERAQSYSTLIGAGVVSADEVRLLEHLGPRPADANANGIPDSTTEPAPETSSPPVAQGNPSTQPGQPGRPTITNV